MKRFAILAILVAAATIGILQRSKLHDLEHRIAIVEKPEGTSNRGKTPPLPSDPPHASERELESLRDDLVAVIQSRMDRSSANRPAAAAFRRMTLTASRFNAGDIELLLQKLRADSRLAGLEEDEFLETLLWTFSPAAPAAMMGFLENHRELPNWANQYTQCFSNFLVTNPREAIRWFDEQAALGNPDVADSSIRASLLHREARVDPDRMLARALSPDFSSDPDTLSHLGAAVASSLSEASEYRQFLAALSRAQEKVGESPALAKIRDEYVGVISDRLAGLPFEDVSAIVDSDFTPGEKLHFLSNVSHLGDLADPAKWADWFLAVDFEAWKLREVPQGTPPDHPANALLQMWVRSDWQAAGKWLEKVQPGPLRSELVQRYSWCIAAVAPEKAATFIQEISDDQERRELIDKIAKALESKDPETAAEFRTTHPTSR